MVWPQNPPCPGCAARLAPEPPYTPRRRSGHLTAEDYSAVRV